MLKIPLVILFVACCSSAKAFTCSEQGLFADIDSPDCTRYYICILEDTRLELVDAVCPPGLVFHTTFQYCVPCSMFDCSTPLKPDDFTTTLSPVTITPSVRFWCPGIGNFPDEESVDCSGFYHCAGPELVPVPQTCPGITTFNWEERRCMANNNAQCPPVAPPFNCGGLGNYPDPNSEDCSHYFRCFANWDNYSVVHTRMSCTGNMAFDWNMLMCRNREQAECLAIRFQCPNAGTFPDEDSLDCGTFLLCSGAGVAPERQTCPGQSTFNWEQRRCVEGNNANCPVSTPPFYCQNFGDFPDVDSEDCRLFYRCFVNWDSSMVHTRMSCPENDIFDWEYNICRLSSEVVCQASTQVPNTITTSITADTTTTSMPEMTTTSQVVPTTSPAEFICPGSGNFPDEFSVDCRNFHVCTGAGLQPNIGNCGGKTIFNWARHTCTSANQISCAMTADPFDCPSAGDFPNPNSKDCSRYYECFTMWSGELQHQIGICQGNTIFDWNRRQCISRNQAACLA